MMVLHFMILFHITLRYDNSSSYHLEFIKRSVCAIFNINVGFFSIMMLMEKGVMMEVMIISAGTVVLKEKLMMLMSKL